MRNTSNKLLSPFFLWSPKDFIWYTKGEKYTCVCWEGLFSKCSYFFGNLTLSVSSVILTLSLRSIILIPWWRRNYSHLCFTFFPVISCSLVCPSNGNFALKQHFKLTSVVGVYRNSHLLLLLAAAVLLPAAVLCTLSSLCIFILIGFFSQLPPLLSLAVPFTHVLCSSLLFSPVVVILGTVVLPIFLITDPLQCPLHLYVPMVSSSIIKLVFLSRPFPAKW